MFEWANLGDKYRNDERIRRAYETNKLVDWLFGQICEENILCRRQLTILGKTNGFIISTFSLKKDTAQKILKLAVMKSIPF